MKRRISILLVSILLVSIFTGCSGGGSTAKPAPSVDKKLYTIGTASMGGSSYAIGSAIATVLNNHINDAQFSVQATAGSNQDIEFMRDGECDLGVLINLGTADAWKSKGAFKGKEPATYLRNLIYVGTWAQHILVSSGSGVKSFSDLRGKKVSVGSAGSGVEDVTRRVCTSLGMNYLQGTPPFMVEYMAVSNASESLANGLLDVAFDTQTVPASAETSAMSPGKVKLLSYTDEELKTVMAADPFSHVIIPAGTYPNQDYDVSTVGFTDSLVARSDLDEEVAYRIVKTLMENLDELQQICPQLGVVTPETVMVGMSVPVHKGGIKYYEEKGIKIPDNLKE